MWYDYVEKRFITLATGVNVMKHFMLVTNRDVFVPDKFFLTFLAFRGKAMVLVEAPKKGPVWFAKTLVVNRGLGWKPGFF